MKFVTRGMLYWIRSIRPESGRIGKWIANAHFSIRPRKKIGMLIPMSETTVPPWSTHVPRRFAVRMPSGIPIVSAKIMAESASSIVAGNR